MGPREVRPELLDRLAEHDPRAVRSRGDLRRINGLMGHARLMAGMLRPRRLMRLLEIGAGDGTLMRGVARRLDISDVCLTLLDQQSPLTTARSEAYERLRWKTEAVQADVFDYLQSPEAGQFDAIVANLFLHHFEDERLASLLHLVAEKTDLFAACEPERSSLGLLGCRLMPLIGCNDVTRHDARVSVRAGFRGRELSALWPSGDWTLEERAVPPFSHVFRAVRA